MGKPERFERTQCRFVKGMARRHEQLRLDAAIQELFLSAFQKLVLLLIAFPRKLRLGIQREAPASFCCIHMMAAVHGKGPAFFLQLLHFFPERFPRRIHRQLRIKIVRYNAQQRIAAIAFKQLFKGFKAFPVHIRCNIIHSKCDFHTLFLFAAAQLYSRIIPGSSSTSDS